MRETLRTFFDEFKTQPLVLALIVTNASLLVYVYYSHWQFIQRAREFQTILAACLEHIAK